MENTRPVTRVCAAVFTVNFLLFGVKLYIGLASNAISIFSDAINNLFDALSVLLTFAVLTVLVRAADRNTARMLQKSEQLFSFLISIVIVFTGLYFAYSALERFMYPAPVWYTPPYLWTLVGTALVKLGLSLLLRRKNRRLDSPVLKMIAFDSLLDFFITCFTVLTLLLSESASFSFDALFGLIISIAITVPAVRMLIAAGQSLINYVPAEKRAAVNEVLAASPAAEKLRFVQYGRFGYETECCAFFTDLGFDPQALEAEVKARTGIRLYCILKKENPNEH